MDKWKDLELNKMKAGGNQKFREFLESQPDFSENWSLSDKYNSRAAALFRDKVSTEAEGREWSASTSSARNYTPTRLAGGGGASSAGGSMKSKQSSQSSLGSYYGGNSSSYGDGGYNSGGGGASSGTGSDNRYQGFGNTPAVSTNEQQDDLLSGAMSSLSMGWSMLSKGASQAAALAKDVGQQATQKATELTGNMSQNSGGLLSGVASRASEIGQKSWGGLSEFVKSPSLQGIGSMLNKSGYEDMNSPDGGVGGSGLRHASSANNTNRYSGNDDWNGFSSTTAASGSNAAAVSSDKDFFSIEDDDDGASLATWAPSTKPSSKKKMGKAAARDEKPKPSLIDLVSPSADEDSSSTIAQFEASFSKSRQPAANSSTSKPQPAAAKKDWDDDAWDILNQ